jgi:hypothetical protein
MACRCLGERCTHRTARIYVRIVRDLAEYFHESPDKLGPEQIRQYQAHLFEAKKFAPATVSQYVSALRRRSSSSIFLRSWVTGTSFFRGPNLSQTLHNCRSSNTR